MANARGNVERKAVAAVREGVAVVGVGNWGSSLLAALRGARVPVLEVVHASALPQGGKHALEGVGLEVALLNARVLWLAVPDGAIRSVAERVGRRRNGALHRQIVVHSSGALNSTLLKSAADAGAAIASVHPLMSFPTRKPVALAGVPFAVEAAVPGARRRLFALVRRLGGRPFVLPSEGKGLYHAAATMASPLLATLLALAIESLEAAGLGREEAMRLLGPIARRTVENVFHSGPEHSFSGPIARGDAATIAMHLSALSAQPLQQEAYRALAAAALALLPSENPEAIRQLLQNCPASGAGPAAPRKRRRASP